MLRPQSLTHQLCVVCRAQAEQVMWLERREELEMELADVRTHAIGSTHPTPCRVPGSVPLPLGPVHL